MPAESVFGICVLSAETCVQRDDWPLQNASIGPIEIPAGTSRQVQVTYPTPDGPSFPLKASVTWSIEPAAKGISIDKTGKLTVTQTSRMAQQPIVGDIEKGRRKLSGKVYVYHPDENPLIGAWHVDTRVACGATQEIKAAATGPVTLRGYDWSFHASQQFWVGREQNIAAQPLEPQATWKRDAVISCCDSWKPASSAATQACHSNYISNHYPGTLRCF